MKISDIRTGHVFVATITVGSIEKRVTGTFILGTRYIHLLQNAVGNNMYKGYKRGFTKVLSVPITTAIKSLKKAGLTSLNLGNDYIFKPKQAPKQHLYVLGYKVVSEHNHFKIGCGSVIITKNEAKIVGTFLNHIIVRNPRAAGTREDLYDRLAECRDVALKLATTNNI